MLVPVLNNPAITCTRCALLSQSSLSSVNIRVRSMFGAKDMMRAADLRHGRYLTRALRVLHSLLWPHTDEYE